MYEFLVSLSLGVWVNGGKLTEAWLLSSFLLFSLVQGM